jgi:putative salt-induced outer membrane protein YdiY
MKIKSSTLALACCLGSATVVAEEADKSFTMDGEFGFIVTTGNTETTSISAGLAATQELDKWSNSYLIEGLYKSDTIEDVAGDELDRTTAQKFFASAQGNYKLTNPNHRLFAFASYEDDRFSNFKYQGTVAGGWNQKMWETETSAFDYSIGPGYSFAEAQDGESRDSAIIRGAFSYLWNVSETSRFTQTFSTEYGSDNVKSRAESALTAQIAGGLSLKVSIKFDHNSDVADGLDKLDTETAVTLVYSFF